MDLYPFACTRALEIIETALLTDTSGPWLPAPAARRLRVRCHRDGCPSESLHVM